MKKLLSLFLGALLLTATLAGCGDDTKKEDKSPDVSSQPKTSATQSELPSTQATQTTQTTPDDVASHDLIYTFYTNEDNTYRVQVLDANNNVLFEKDKLSNRPIKAEINDTITELAWATGNGPSDFEAVYWDKKAGKLTQVFLAPRGTDGVRIAYTSADETKIIVQDLFDKSVYYKEHKLENATKKNGNIISGGRLHENNKTVIISYHSSDADTPTHITISLYD